MPFIPLISLVIPLVFPRPRPASTLRGNKYPLKRPKNHSKITIFNESITY